MEQYIITGMSCAACSARIEKAVLKVAGVESCSVSLLTNTMGVSGSAKKEDIIKAVCDAGYGASLKGQNQDGNSGKNADGDILKDTETPKLKKRLTASVIFLIILMYFSMGHMMWNWPIPAYFIHNHVAVGLLQLLLTVIIMVINQKFFISGFQSLFHGSPNMDTLVALGAGAAFVYSTYALFAMTDAQAAGNEARVLQYTHEFYFESAAMILTLITVGKMLEAKSKGRTTDALKGLMKLAPKTAVIIHNGEECEVLIDEVKKGDIFVVRPGENIPVDGIVTEGSSAINESALTGESIPIDKKEGDSVSAATQNLSGFLKCEATRVGEDTTLSQIIKMVSDAAATKAPIAKTADTVSGVFVPIVIGLALLTLLCWILSGAGAGYALARGISVLVISCPCALGLATPVAIMVGNGVGAKNGILFKTAVSLEETGKTDIVVLDKTGTVTLGQPKVTDVIADKNCQKEELLQLAFSLEQKSEHPLAKAVLEYGREKETEALNITDFTALPGNGLSGIIDGVTVYGGNEAFICQKARISDETVKLARTLSMEGKTPLYFSKGNTFLGIIAVADVIKPDSPDAIAQLRNMGIQVVMLTGDNENTAKAIGKKAGVDDVIAGVLPDGKEAVIRRLQEQGKVAMVGDGINDAPALTRGDIGIAIGAGTDIAIDAADVVLMKSVLSDVPAAIRLSRATLKNIHENLFWAFFYNIIGIPLAAGIWIPLFHWELNPMFAAAAMSLSSFCVVTNALRLNLCRIYDTSRDKIKKGKKKSDKEDSKTIKTEGKNMTKTIKVEGMMCEHCEARVKKTMEALEQVDAAVADHSAGTVVLTLNAEIDEALLKEAIEGQDYKYLGME